VDWGPFFVCALAIGIATYTFGAAGFVISAVFCFLCTWGATTTDGRRYGRHKRF
jgi:hypothetical protein